jgi:uncharacterized protein with HEPN domain
MPREINTYLDDIIQAIDEIKQFSANLIDVHGLESDVKSRRAIERNLEIIGEAVKHLPSDLLARQPEIEWSKITGLRDILAHAYFVIDDIIIWDIIRNKLQALRAAVEFLRE